MAPRLFSVFTEASLKRRSWLLTGLVFVLAAIPRLTSLRAFLAVDERLYWTLGREFFFALLHGDWLGTVVGRGNPSITIFWAHSLVMGLKYAWAWLTGAQATALATWPDFQPEPVFDLMVERRLPLVLSNALAVVIAYRLVQRLLGARLAMFAAILLALDPFYLSDSRTSRGEGFWAGLAMLAVLSYLAYWTERRYRYLCFSSMMTGLALLTQISAISLAVWAIVATLVLALAQYGSLRKTRPGQVLATLGVWGLGVVATFWVLWPAMWVSPGRALGFIWSFVANVGVSGRDNFFFGQVYQNEPLPFYYLVVFVLRVTPLAWLGLFAVIGCLRYSQPWQFPLNLSDSERRRPLIITLILAFALIYTAMMTVGTLKRDFYLIPAFPAFDIAAAGGLVWGFELIWHRWGPVWMNRLSLQAAWTSGLVATLVLQAMTSLPAHPYYYTYWNPLVLGNRWAPQAVMLQQEVDLSAAAHYLNSKPNAKNLWAATRTISSFEQIFAGHTVRWVPEQPWIQADYLVVRLYHLQREKIEPYLLDYLSRLKLDHIVTIGGVDYVWIYEGPKAEYFAGPSTLTGKATLFGYNLGDPVVGASGALPVKLYWQNRGMTSDDNLFLQLVDADGYIWNETAAIPLPDFQEAALTKDQIVEGQALLTIPTGTPPRTYYLRMGVYDQAKQEILGYFGLPASGDEVIVTRPTMPLSATSLAIPHRLELKVSPEISLLGFGLVGDTLRPSDDNWLTLYWQAEADVSKDYVVGLQLFASDGEEATYWLGRPVMSSYPTNEWIAGEIVRDPWRLTIPASLPAGHYTLALSVYDAVTTQLVNGTSLGEIWLTSDAD